MSERLTVQWEDKRICAFELTDARGQYNEELRRTLRLASQEGSLCCPDCKQRMVLCAGAIVQPYFRHFTLADCNYSIAFRTKAGQRTYLCRQALYRFAKDAGFPNLVQEEKKDSRLSPVVFDAQAGKIGYVYLDGKNRNYNDLTEQYLEYKDNGIRLYFFLNIAFLSDALNITSDEAECARLNDGDIYYLDQEKNSVRIRRKYTDEYGIRREFCANYQLKELCPDADGKITGEFLEQFHKLRREEKRRAWKVLRNSAEDGIDEFYEDFDFLLMDSIEEIWILPFFPFQTEDAEEHRRKRMEFLEFQNEEMWQMEEDTRLEYARNLVKYILERRNSWDWA